MNNSVMHSAEKMDKVREKVDLKAHLIIREQEQIIEVATTAIKQLNSDLLALKRRLEPRKEGPYDDAYYDLKDRYTNKLAERAVLENARTMAEESISASKLYVVPGEFDRSEY